MRTPTAGVGATAVVVAAARAAENRRADRLFHDPLAERFLAEARKRTPVEAVEVVRHPMEHYFAIRTRYFDDVLRRAVAEGCRQVAVLGAGLDTRAFRLDWPIETRVFEVDLPEVFAFKEPVVEAAGAEATCARTVVPTDLSADWEAALLRAGFDPGLPTAWLIEGVLCYLPGKADDAVLAGVTRLSAPGSRLAGEHVSHRVFTDPVARPMLDALESVGAPWLSGIDDIGTWLGASGWESATADLTDPAVHHGRITPVDRERIAAGPTRGWIFRAWN
ncbi:SAM-dependent methyltransferase [Streptomyces californicus]|uniref:SAM-dependent methyltransferase n=1 Tax=Streptomyces californicus TaxID=67351 RepID=UPI0036DB3022